MFAALSVFFAPPSPVTSTVLASSELPEAFHDLDLVFLHQVADAGGQLADDVELALHHRAEIDADFLGDDAVRGEPFAREMEMFGRGEQRLARDAADVEARPAEGRVLLDDRRLEAKLRGADGGDIAAGSAADDDELIIKIGHDEKLAQAMAQHHPECAARRRRTKAAARRGSGFSRKSLNYLWLSPDPGLRGHCLLHRLTDAVRQHVEEGRRAGAQAHAAPARARRRPGHARPGNVQLARDPLVPVRPRACWLCSRSAWVCSVCPLARLLALFTFRGRAPHLTFVFSWIAVCSVCAGVPTWVWAAMAFARRRASLSLIGAPVASPVKARSAALVCAAACVSVRAVVAWAAWPFRVEL